MALCSLYWRELCKREEHCDIVFLGEIFLRRLGSVCAVELLVVTLLSALKLSVDVAPGTVENKCVYYNDGKHFDVNTY